MRTPFILPVVLTMAAVLTAATLEGPPDGGSGKASGGPDAWGYRYIDSDSPDTAAYSWRDTTSGTWFAVNGLTDDNAVGPFNMGFNFPYYWYSVDQFWVQSNGGISFSIPSRAWTPQNTGESGFPNTALPQDLIGAYGFDLDFTAGGRCRYRTRSTPPESLIVSWLGVRQWNSTRTFTFQIILARADSSIRFQYQTATAWQTAASIGVENMTGGVGLEYYENGTPAGNVPHNGLAVKIYPPATSAYTSADAGVVAVMNPSSGAVTVHTNDALRPRATLKNFGTSPITITRAVCRIRNSAGTVVFADTLSNIVLNKAQQVDTSFSRTFSPTASGTYRMVVRTTATESPANAANDSIIVELPVVTYPAWVAYDDGAGENWMAWSGTGAASPTGFGNLYVLTRYPTIIDSIQVFVSHQNNNYLWVGLYDTTGQGGGPGNLLATDTVRLVGNVTNGEWISVSYTSRNITLADGSLFVCVLTPSANVRFRMDQTVPISRRCWEYTGGWTPYRNMETQEAMIRVKCRPRPSTMAFYVDSANGSDANAGTFTLPFKTINRALTVMQGTDTGYVRNGTYHERLDLLPRHSGTATRYTVLRAQPGHSPAIRAGGEAYTLADSGASYLVVKGFTIYPGTQQMSVVLQSARACSLNNNTIYVPTMGPGILAMDLRSSAIRANRVLPVGDNPYPAQGIWVYYSDSLRVDSNIVSGLADVGILLEGTNRTAVCRNAVDHCLMGLGANYSGNDSVYNNTIDASGDIGIHIQGLWGNLVVHNTNLTNSRYGFGWVDGQGTIVSNYNNLWNNSASNYAYAGHTVGAGANDISADPLYGTGYVLTAGSPCIDAGTPVGLPASGPPDIGAYEFGLKDQSGTTGEPAERTAFGLTAVHPNPFRDRTTIEYWSPLSEEAGGSRAMLRVYNISGQLVKTLVDGAQTPGRHAAQWDGRDAAGRRVAAGIYYCRLEAGGRRAVRALTLLR